MNIRFDVMHKREGRLFTGAGLSSFRIPLKHIGMGQVDLFSIGLQFSVKYNSR
jgi:hypothetical protein